MRRTSILWMTALACFALPGADRPGVIMTGSGSFGQVVVRFTTIAEPPLTGYRGMPGGINVRNDRVHRYMVDTVNHQYFGYDLVVEAAEGKSHRVRIEPLSLGPQDLRGFGDNVPPAPLLLPKYPPPQTVEDGDTIALDLLVSPDGRQKIVDYIQVESKVEPPAAKGQAEARDFTLDDGPLSFSFRSPAKLLINGQNYARTMGMTAKPGGTLWFSVPGRGRYVLSLAPHDGFQKAGAIRDNVIMFQDDGERYELRTSGPIIGSGGVWNLYVLHDPLYPAGDMLSYGTGRLENLLPKH